MVGDCAAYSSVLRQLRKYSTTRAPAESFGVVDSCLHRKVSYSRNPGNKLGVHTLLLAREIPTQALPQHDANLHEASDTKSVRASVCSDSKTLFSVDICINNTTVAYLEIG